MNLQNRSSVLCLIVIYTLAIILILELQPTSANPLPGPVAQKGADLDKNKFHSWDGRYYDNEVQDAKKFAEQKTAAKAGGSESESKSKKLTPWHIVGIAVGGVVLFLFFFCCIGYCLCACVKELLCCVKNCLCCCCDD